MKSENSLHFNKKVMLSFSVACSIIVLLIFIFLFYEIDNKIIEKLSLNEKILVCFLSVIFLFIILYLQCIINLFTFFYLEKNIFILMLSIIFINISALLYIISLPKKTKNKNKIFINTTFEYLIMGMSVAVFLIIDFVESFIPTIPLFITFSFHLIPLFFYSYLSKFINSFIVCFISALLTWLMPNNADAGVSYVAYIFDYLIPITFISISSLTKPSVNKDIKIKNVIEWFIFIFFPLLIGYFSKVISGVLFWFNSSWSLGKWSYSFVFNLFNFTFDLILLYIFVPVVCKILDPIKIKYYE